MTQTTQADIDAAKYLCFHDLERYGMAAVYNEYILECYNECSRKGMRVTISWPGFDESHGFIIDEDKRNDKPF